MRLETNAFQKHIHLTISTATCRLHADQYSPVAERVKRVLMHINKKYFCTKNVDISR